EEVARMRWPEFTHPEDVEIVTKLINKVLAGETEGYTIDIRYIRKDGEIAHVNVSAWCTRKADRTVEKFIVFIQDITEHKRAGEKLRESEARFQQLAEAIDDVFVVSDVKSKSILYVSPAYEQIWGRPVQELYEDFGQLDEGIHPDDRLRIQEAWARMVDQGDRCEEEFRVLHTDGSLRWVRSRWYPLRDQSGQVFRVAEINQDITDFKRDQQALLEREAMLTDAA
ncbi:MAG: PAS domain-containing protein, partial [Anaerolineae bacterium]|nr:PAS domain-containing protein [Anaerolineae bacterium]